MPKSGPDIPQGPVVRVRLGFALGATAIACVSAAVVGLFAGMSAWALLVLTICALAVSVAAAAVGISGIIRYGIFTEGSGSREVRHDLRLAAWARAAATAGSATLIGSLVLAVVVLVKIAL